MFLSSISGNDAMSLNWFDCDMSNARLQEPLRPLHVNWSVSKKITPVISSSLSKKTSGDSFRSMSLGPPCCSPNSGGVGQLWLQPHWMPSSQRKHPAAPPGQKANLGIWVSYGPMDPGGLHCKHQCFHHNMPRHAFGAAFSPQIRELMRQKRWCSVTRRKLTKKVLIKMRVPFRQKGSVTAVTLWYCRFMWFRVLSPCKIVSDSVAYSNRLYQIMW